MGRQIEGQRQSVVNEESVRFLTTEFEQLVEFWKITDARYSGQVNIYLTACLVIATGSAAVAAYFSSKAALNPQLVMVLAGILSLGLFVLGVYLLRSLVTTRKLKTEYRRALNVIRGYFVDQDPKLQDYLMLPFASRAAMLSLGNDVRPMSTSLFRAWESVLIAIVIGCAAWLIKPILLSISIIVLSILGAILCYILLHLQSPVGSRAPAKSSAHQPNLRTNR